MRLNDARIYRAIQLPLELAGWFGCFVFCWVHDLFFRDVDSQ